MFGKRSDETRTAEDRARAAAERAARRAGRPLPPEAFEDAVRPPGLEDFRRPEPPPPPPPPPPAPPPVAAPPPEPDEPVEPARQQHTVEYTPFETAEHNVPGPAGAEPRVRRIPRTDPPAVAPQPAAIEPQSPEEDDEAGLPAGAASPEDSEQFEPVEPLAPIAVTDRPLPPRRPAPATPRKRPPAPPGLPRRSRGSYWGRRVFGVVALVVILVALYAINKTFQPFHPGPDSRPVAVVIPDKSNVGAIGKLLAAKGVIDSATFFQVNATVTGRRGGLRPGTYTLYRNMSNGDVLDRLTKGPKGGKAAPTFKVTIPEGPSRKEMAATIDKSAVDGSYMKASGASSVLNRVRSLGAPKGTKTPEGFLFPATYTLAGGASAADLVGQQLTAFADNFRGVDLGYAKTKHLTRYDVLIIASMIEREAQLPRERALVSAVIYNRLKRGMPLGIDATIRYYTNNWKRPIRQSELQADEPYNSRLNRGLPPTPIGNPGLASLKAAAKPANKPYLFYVRKPGNSGEHAFSSTDAQFARDVKKYQNARTGK